MQGEFEVLESDQSTSSNGGGMGGGEIFFCLK